MKVLIESIRRRIRHPGESATIALLLFLTFVFTAVSSALADRAERIAASAGEPGRGTMVHADSGAPERGAAPETSASSKPALDRRAIDRDGSFVSGVARAAD